MKLHLQDIFYANLALYKEGYYDMMSWRDIVTGEDIALHPKQVQALDYWNDDEITSLGFGGSARGGKSLLICVAILFDCFAYPGTAYLLGRRDMVQFYATTWKTWIRLLQNFGFDQKDYVHNQKYNTFTFNNGSNIFLKNLELKPRDPEATEFGSMELTKAAIDQSENVNIKIVDKIIERVGSKLNEHYDIKGKCMEVFNPAPAHTKQRFWIPFRDNTESESKKFVRALSTDNPGKEAQRWVAEKIKDYNDGIMSRVEYEKQIEGNFDYDDDPNKIFDTESAESMFYNDFIEPNYSQVFMTVDPAGQGKDKTVIWIWYGKKYVMTTYEVKETDPKKLIKIIKQFQDKYGIPNNRVIYDAPGLGNYISGYIKGAVAFYGNSTKMSRKEKVIYPNIRNLCYFTASEHVNRAKIYIADQTHKTRILNELSHIKTKDNDPDGKRRILSKKEIRKSLGSSPDHADCLMMSRLMKSSSAGASAA